MDLNAQKTGIVLMNTGTPDSPDPADIRPYLVEFLSDRNLIKVPPIVWQPVLRLFISRTRPKKTSPRYQQIWTPEGSPLIVETFAQRDALNARLEAAGINAITEVGMRYGNPSTEAAVVKLEAAGCTRIVALPLFPQTAYCTVGSCVEKITKAMRKHQTLELAKIIKGYDNNPLYAKALEASIREVWDYRPGSKILFSFHSIPMNDVEDGDTYTQQIETDLTQVVSSMGIADEDWAIAYHSRFEDSRKWVTPHPKTQLAKWAEEGATRVAIATPGFAADCLESLYDIGDVTCEYFRNLCQQNGHTADITYIPCLNHREDHIDLLFDVIKKALATL